MRNIKIIADENINRPLINVLRESGYEVLSVFEQNRGVPDICIIELARTGPYIILTEDKDFGEWFFAHREPNFSVILLRYHYREENTIINSLLTVLDTHGDELFGKFTVVTTTKIRMRDF